MKEMFPVCCICPEGAEWVRTRMPNDQQMHALCQRHYLSLKERNQLLASYYDKIAALPAQHPQASAPAQASRSAHRPEEYSQEA